MHNACFIQLGGGIIIAQRVETSSTLTSFIFQLQIAGYVLGLIMISHKIKTLEKK